MDWIEPLENRTLLSSVPTNVNISRLSGNQSEGSITIDPTNPQRVVAFSNTDVNAGAGLVESISADGGATWTRKVIAKGNDSLIPACCDPSAAFDSFGNLFLTYVNDTTDAVVILRSSDGGQNFTQLKTINGEIDQPTVTTGAGAVWITYNRDRRIYVLGAPVSGLGSSGAFTSPALVPGPISSNFGDIAIGPDGQVMVTYQAPSNNKGPSKIYINVDPDGLGSEPFGKSKFVTSTEVGGFRYIRPQNVGGIDAEPGLAYDRSGGPFNGRVYLVYTDAPSTTSKDTNIRLRFSDDDGATWSSAKRVNDDSSKNSQFLPRMAVDQTTGNVAFIWHDSRKDTGKGSGSTNSRSNDDAQLWGAAGVPTAKGLTLSKNIRISAGTSNADRADNSIDYGDYTGLAFHNNTFIPTWADNSNSTSNNPNGKLKRFDMYIARVPMPVLS